MSRGMRPWAVALLLVVGTASTTRAEESEELAAAKQVENPIANIVNAKVQNNTSYLIGPNERTQNILNLQLTVPISLSQRLVLIGLTRIPLAWQPDVASPTDGTFGLADISINLYFGLKPKRILFWGVGPAMRLPTGTAKGLGALDSGKFSLGPTAAVVVTPGRWVLGLFVTNVWSVGGRESGIDVNTLLVQPLVDLNLPAGWYLTYAPNIVCDWTAPDNSGWLVPVGGGVGKVKLFKSKVALGFEAQAFWNVVRPPFGPLWTLRLQLSLAFPRALEGAVRTAANPPPARPSE